MRFVKKMLFHLFMDSSCGSPFSSWGQCSKAQYLFWILAVQNTLENTESICRLVKVGKLGNFLKLKHPAKCFFSFTFERGCYYSFLHQFLVVLISPKFITKLKPLLSYAVYKIFLVFAEKKNWKNIRPIITCSLCISCTEKLSLELWK